MYILSTNYYKAKHNWSTHCKYFNYIFSCISMTKECYQIGFLNLKLIEELFISSIS